MQPPDVATGAGDVLLRVLVLTVFAVAAGTLALGVALSDGMDLIVGGAVLGIAGLAVIADEPR